MKKTFTLLACTLFVCSLALATTARAGDIGPYLNFSLGQTGVDPDISDFDEDTSYSLGFGFSFNRNFALEVSYIDFGDLKDDIPPVWTLSGDAVTACVIGKIPLNPVAAVYGKLGFAAWDAELKEAGFGTFFKDDGTDLTIGLGLLLHATDNVSAFVQYQMYEFDDLDVDNVSAGIQIGF